MTASKSTQIRDLDNKQKITAHQIVTRVKCNVEGLCHHVTPNDSIITDPIYSYPLLEPLDQLFLRLGQ